MAATSVCSSSIIRTPRYLIRNNQKPGDLPHENALLTIIQHIGFIFTVASVLLSLIIWRGSFLAAQKLARELSDWKVCGCRDRAIQLSLFYVLPSETNGTEPTSIAFGREPLWSVGGQSVDRPVNPIEPSVRCD